MGLKQKPRFKLSFCGKIYGIEKVLSALLLWRKWMFHLLPAFAKLLQKISVDLLYLLSSGYIIARALPVVNSIFEVF